MINMSYHNYSINPREVVEYLNELGYQNISANQLKEFIKDLKKLIKYDQRMREYQSSFNENSTETQPQKPDIFTTLYETGTAASIAKETKKEKVISVQIKRPPPQLKRRIEQEQNYSSSEELLNISRKGGRDVPHSSNEQNIRVNETTESSLQEKFKSEDNRKITNLHGTIELKPKASFIRPKPQVKTCKSDPVALYHYYQTQWKKQKIPGEDNHSNLRWVIREKMLGDAEITSNAPSLNKLRKKRPVSAIL